MTLKLLNTTGRYIFFMILSLISIGNIFGQQKFHCDGDIFLSSVNGINKNTTFYYLGKYTDNWNLNPFSIDNPVQINAIGFSAKDSLIYGIEPTKHQLYSIDATGKAFFIDYIPLLGNFYAGDVTPDSKELVLFRSDSIAFIDLENHAVRYLKTKSKSGEKVFCTDIAFNFKTGVLYGYDAISTKLVTIDIQTGLIDNIKFQEIKYFSSIPALFFNENGDLFGIGTDFSNQTSFIYQFDLVTGTVSSKPFDFFIGERDACSCPPGLRLISQTDNTNYLPCSEIQFTYMVSNYSNSISEKVRFEEVYPAGFSVVGIENNLGGTLVTSINSNKVSIEDLTIPKGEFTLTVTVAVPKDAKGNYEISPVLIQSDGSTIETNTPDNNPKIEFKIDNVEADLTKFYNDTLEICDDPIAIDLPYFKDLSYAWSTGDSLSKLDVFEHGHYEVTLTTTCETIVKTFDVVDSDLQIEIDQNITLNAGTSLELNPIIDSKTPITDLQWTASPSDPTICKNCPTIQINPKVDTKYTLRIENDGLCMKYIDIDVKIKRNIYFPNAFTPNFDGINDVFFISSSGTPLKINRFSIYDRWGGIVFENDNGVTNNAADGWDGTFNGKIASNGTYVWIVELETPEGYSILKQGTISIINK